MTRDQRLGLLAGLDRALARHIRNQQVIDDMARNFGIYQETINPPTKEDTSMPIDVPPRPMRFDNETADDFAKPAPLLTWPVIGAIVAFTIISFLVLTASLVLAQTSDLTAIKCPNPGEPCKVLVLTPNEEKVLTGPNAILDTAAQGRSIELSGAVVYMKNKIQNAPEGTVQAPPPPPKAPPGPVTQNNAAPASPPEKQVTIPPGSGAAKAVEGAAGGASAGTDGTAPAK